MSSSTRTPADRDLVAWLEEHPPPLDPREEVERLGLIVAALAAREGPDVAAQYALLALARPVVRAVRVRAIAEERRQQARRTILWWYVSEAAGAAASMLDAAAAAESLRAQAEAIRVGRRIADRLATEAAAALAAAGPDALAEALRAEEARLAGPTARPRAACTARNSRADDRDADWRAEALFRLRNGLGTANVIPDAELRADADALGALLESPRPTN